MPRRQTVKACCGRKAVIIHFDSAFNRGHLAKFHRHGYTSPPQYTKTGVLYLKKDSMTVTGTFGSKHVNIRCRGLACAKFIDAFEKLAEQILLSKA